MIEFDFDPERIDAVLSDLDKPSEPGFALGISRHGEPVYARACGLACRELPTPLTTATRMAIGSVTKHFTALAYMLLCERNGAAIDDPVAKHLPELCHLGQDVLVADLMGHTSGLLDAYDISYHVNGTGMAVRRADLFNLYRSPIARRAIPRTTWNYNNGGYLLLTEIVERGFGKPISEVFRERIFEPAQLASAAVKPFDSDFLPDAATLHMTDERGRFVKSYLNAETTGEFGIWANVDDLLSWAAQLGHLVGSAESWAAMTTPRRLANGVTTNYALGLIVSETSGITSVSHAGGVMGGSAKMLKLLEPDVAIVCMTNRHDVSADELCSRILRTLTGDNAAPARRPGSSLGGAYRGEKSKRILRIDETEAAPRVEIDGVEAPFEVSADGLLRPTATWRFCPQSIEGVEISSGHALRFDDFGTLETFRAMGVEPAVILRNGRYCAPELRASAEITTTSAGRQLRLAGWAGLATFAIEPLGGRLFRCVTEMAMPWGGIIEFAEDGASFELTTPRNRNLLFHRVADNE